MKIKEQAGFILIHTKFFPHFTKTVHEELWLPLSLFQSCSRSDHVLPLLDTAGYKVYRWDTNYQRGMVCSSGSQ